MWPGLAGLRILVRCRPQPSWPTSSTSAGTTTASPCLADRVDPEVELICDPLRPDESALHGIEGWRQWAARWERSYDDCHITVDGLVPLDAEHVLAFVSITATPAARGALHWAAAHLWTLRDGRIAGWETHLDLAAARQRCSTLRTARRARARTPAAAATRALVALELERDVEALDFGRERRNTSTVAARMSTSQSSGNPCCS